MPAWSLNPVLVVTSVLVYLGAVVQSGPIAPGGSDLPTDTPIVAIGRCRVQCLKKFPLQSGPDMKAKELRHRQQEREECWKLCENLVRNPRIYAPMCSGKVCSHSEGCQTACSSRNSPKSASNTTTEPVHWRFPQDVETTTDYMWIHMLWMEPEPTPVPGEPQAENSGAHSEPRKAHPVVYTLLMREKNDAWQLIGQTDETSFSMAYDEARFVPEFLIQAIDESGVIAEKVFYVNQMIFRDIIEDPVSEYGALEEGGTAVTLISHNTVNLSYTMHYVSSGEHKGLTAQLSWEHPDDIIADGGVTYYHVIYILKDCGVYEDLPKCSNPTDLYNTMVPVKNDEKPQYTVTDLLYNTAYQVRVELVEKVSAELADIMIRTPRCHIPSEDFRHCHDPVVTESPDFTTEPTQPSLSELVRDITVRLLPYNDEPGYVLVNISWNFISDPSVANFSVKILHDDDEDGFSVTRETVSGTTHFVTRLLDNTVYEVVVDVFDPSRGGEVEFAEGFVESDDDVMYLDDSQQRMHFNTSELQLAAQEVPQAVRMRRQHMRAVNGVIIGVTCVGVLVFVAFLGFFLYKKRQSFKDIIIPKTTVAKSNSYKSSVGGKADYSNQLMVFSDEWELDPRQLKFSTPLGQGAFGKVVTGYYSDRKVAIKLVKEGAPVSYKEDLVAEINLMKRLGNHPNIVCLIGACTVTEPIALVMEYVPYGNLQNFLKKCRLEGDLQKRSNGPSEIQYSMLQDCGGIENGVITPTDMLSFARQVAMAMEYLAEKKYVHRDLAARNVLLHYNKVVKVCDFGLSRDIYNDNQYKKLTNGKLPLKWMAIESLRDRVFTTQSDVWSFGILLWEIVTMGASPYPNIALADLYYVLSNNYRMDKPSNCSNELYALMRTCWADNPLDRPTFMELREQLEDLMAEDRNYLVLEEFDVPLSASDSSSNPTASELFSSDMRPSPAAMDAVGSVGSSESSSAASASASASASGLLRQGPPMRRPPMTIDVCIHQKSTERLMRPSESDSSPSE